MFTAPLQQGPVRCRPLPRPRAPGTLAQASAQLQQQYEACLLPEFSLLGRLNIKQSGEGLSAESAADLALAPDEAWRPLDARQSLADLPSLGSKPLDLRPKPIVVTDPIPEEEKFDLRALLAGTARAWGERALPRNQQLDAPLLLLPCAAAGKEAALPLAELITDCQALTEELPALDRPNRSAYQCAPELVSISPLEAAPRFTSPVDALLRAPALPSPCVDSGCLLLGPLLLNPESSGGECVRSDDLRLMLDTLAVPIASPSRCADLSSLLGRSLADLELAPSPLPLPAPQERRRPPSALALLDRLLAPRDTGKRAAEQPTALLSAAEQGDAGGGSGAIFFLEPPLLPPAEGWPGLDALPPLPEAAAAPALRLRLPGCEALTLEALLARELRLDDGGPMLLPAVALEDASHAESRGLWLSDLVISDCGVRPASTAHLALHLDWSLSSAQRAVRPAALQSAQRELLASLQPRAVALPPGGDRAARQRAAVLQVLLALCPADEGASLLAPRMENRLRCQPAPALLPQGEALPQASKAAVPEARQGRRADAAAPAPPHEGLSYFMKLHQPPQGRAPAGALPGAAAAQQPALHAAHAALSSSSDDTAEAIAAYGHSRARTLVALELPPAHRALLACLREDERRLVAGSQGLLLSPEVLASDFLSLDALRSALQQCAGPQPQPQQQQRQQAQQQQVGARAAARVYAAMAVVRQAAGCLLHHGARCAHLYLAQSLAELPGLLGGVTSARDLARWYEEVESGHGEDHPKLNALRRLLTGTATLVPSAVVLAVGEPQSLWTFYQPALDAGLRPSHFDPGDELLGAGEVQLLQALKQTCAAGAESGGACVLVSSQHVLRGGFPLHLFQHIIVCTTEPDTQAALLPLLEGARCPQHVLQMQLPTWDEPPGGEILGGTPLRAAPVAPTALPALERPGADAPLVVSSDARSVIRQRRPLYEGLLRLEREGAGLVERPLSLLDLVLSPSTALIIHDNTEGVDLEAVMASLAPVLQRVSYAFSRVILVLEGSPGFQAQVLCGMARILALGRGCGLHLQCFPSTAPAATEAIVLCAARAAMAAWKAQDPSMHYAISGEATLEEGFLTRFFSLNTHSAAVLMSLALSMQQILHLGPAPGKGDSPLLGLLPRHSLALFSQCAAWGSPLLGIGGAGDLHVEAGSATTAGGGFLAHHAGHHPGDGRDWHGGSYHQEAYGPQVLQPHPGGDIDLQGRVWAHQTRQQQQPERQGQRQRLEQARDPRLQQQRQHLSLEQAYYEQQLLMQQQQQQQQQQEQQGRSQRQYPHYADELAGQPCFPGQQQQQEPDMGWPGQERQEAMQYSSRGAAAAADPQRQGGWTRQAGYGQADGGALAGPGFGVAGVGMDPGMLFSAQLVDCHAASRQGRGGEPQRRMPDEELQRSRQIIRSRLQGVPAHAAPAWHAMGGAAPADDLEILMPEFDHGNQLGGLLATSTPGRKRGWASLAGDDAWPAQQAPRRPQHGGLLNAQGLGGWSPALAEGRHWAEPLAQALQRQQRQAGGGLGAQDPGDLHFDLSDDEESDHDATLAANLSAFGAPRPQPRAPSARQGGGGSGGGGGGGGGSGHTLGLPLHAQQAPTGRAAIASFLDSRPAGFSIPRLARPGPAAAQQQQGTASSDELALSSEDGAGTPASRATRPPGEFRHFTQGRKTPAKKWTAGWRGYPQSGGVGTGRGRGKPPGQRW